MLPEHITKEESLKEWGNGLGWVICIYEMDEHGNDIPMQIFPFNGLSLQQAKLLLESQQRKQWWEEENGVSIGLVALTEEIIKSF